MDAVAAVDEYDWAGFADGLEQLMLPMYEELLQLAAGDAGRSLPVAVSFGQGSPRVMEAAQRLGQQIRGVADSVKQDAQRVVAEGLSRGDSIDTIASGLETYLGEDSKKRAVTIARTETAQAYSEGAIATYQDAGVQQKKWLASDGSCEDCAASDGEVVGMGEAFSNGAQYPPLHPNCTCAVAPAI